MLVPMGSCELHPAGLLHPTDECLLPFKCLLYVQVFEFRSWWAFYSCMDLQCYSFEAASWPLHQSLQWVLLTRRLWLTTNIIRCWYIHRDVASYSNRSDTLWSVSLLLLEKVLLISIFKPVLELHALWQLPTNSALNSYWTSPCRGHQHLWSKCELNSRWAWILRVTSFHSGYQCSWW